MGKIVAGPAGERELGASAVALERQQGEFARSYANGRIEALEAIGNRDGALLWRAILNRLEEPDGRPVSVKHASCSNLLWEVTSGQRRAT